jgi:glycosyltransferase involved in cell wall biosynthesis
MKILFITCSAIFPPNSGQELPTSELIKYLSERHEVDMLVAVPQGQAAQLEASRLKNAPESVNVLGCLPIQAEPRYLRFLKACLLIEPYFMYRKFDHQALANLVNDHEYDFTWISRMPALGVYKRYSAKRSGLGKVCLGLNDNMVGHEINASQYFWEYLKRGKLVPGYLLNLLKVPFVFFHERQMLKQAAVVHLQTSLEMKRCRREWPEQSKYIVAPNGLKDELRKCSYQGRHSKNVLLMSQLVGKRGLDVKWFVSNVWNRIVAAVPDAKLCIVGRHDASDTFWQNLPASVELTAYADDLRELFESVRLVTVPTLHNSGLLNRILDGVAAGVPVVTTPQAAQTIDGFTDQVHGYASRGARRIASSIVHLLNDDETCLEMSRQCRKLADQKNNWNQSCQAIEDFLQLRVDEKRTN